VSRTLSDIPGLFAFPLHFGHGFTWLSPDDLVFLLAHGPDAFLQSFYVERWKISPLHYRTWVAHCQDPHCHALNNRGEPCRHSIEVIWDPQAFDPGLDTLCEWHQREWAERYQ